MPTRSCEPAEQTGGELSSRATGSSFDLRQEPGAGKPHAGVSGLRWKRIETMSPGRATAVEPVAGSRVPVFVVVP